MKPASVMIDLSKVDWPLLAAQKSTLVAIHEDRREMICYDDGEKEVDHLSGLIDLLDDIQDQAAAALGEKKVFGSKCEDGKPGPLTVKVACWRCHGYPKDQPDGYCDVCGLKGFHRHPWNKEAGKC